MITCKDCQRKGIRKEADEVFGGRALCQSCYAEILEKKHICPICKKEFSVFNKYGDRVEGHFATMHNECYQKLTMHEIDWNGNPIKNKC